MGDEMTPTSLSERLIRMEGKIDAYAASQSAIVAETQVMALQQQIAAQQPTPAEPADARE